MKKFFLIGMAVLCFALRAAAQQDYSYVYQGEFGISAGVSQYFGDLNPDLHFNTPKPVFGIFFRKQLTDYIAVGIQGQYAQLGYSDVYNTQNAFDQRRNLSFNTNIWQLGLQGDFNFFRFIPGDGATDYPLSDPVSACSASILCLPRWPEILSQGGHRRTGCRL
jgi:hypothetical protein